MNPVLRKVVVEGTPSVVVTLPTRDASTRGLGPSVTQSKYGEIGPKTDNADGRRRPFGLLARALPTRPDNPLDLVQQQGPVPVTTPAPVTVSVPPKEKPSIKSFSDLTAADLAQMPEEMRAVIDSLPVLSESRYPELAGLEANLIALISKIALAKDGSGPIHVVILDDCEPNAFVTRSKNTDTRILAVTIGLVRRLENDDQAVAVLGHELEHLSSQLYPYIEDFMAEAKGNLEKLYLLMIKKAEEIEVDLKALFHRVHRQGYNPTEILKFMNKFIRDLPDGLSLSHPLMKTRRNAVEFALTGLRRILGEKLSTALPKNEFVDLAIRDFLTSPQFAASRREIFKVSRNIQQELDELIRRIQTDTLTKEDSLIMNTGNLSLFDQVVANLLERNRRELFIFQDEAQVLDLTHRMLLFATAYVESQLNTILGVGFVPKSTTQINAYACLKHPILRTQTWGGQFFRVGEFAVEIDRLQEDLKRLDGNFARRPSPSRADEGEYSGSRKHLVDKINRLQRHFNAQRSTFDDSPEVDKAIQIYKQWGAEGGVHGGAQIPEKIHITANGILRAHLRYIGPKMVHNEGQRQKKREADACKMMVVTDKIGDLHAMLWFGIVSTDSQGSTTRLFFDNYCRLATAAIAAGTADALEISAIQRNLVPRKYLSHADVVAHVRSQMPKEFFAQVKPVFEAMARHCFKANQINWLFNELGKPDAVKHIPHGERGQLMHLALERIHNLAIEAAQHVSQHTPAESLTAILKPRFGASSGDHSTNAEMVRLYLRHDEWAGLPDDVKMYDISENGVVSEIGTAGKLKAEGKTPPSALYGFTQWVLEVKAPAEDLRSYLTCFETLARMIDQSGDLAQTRLLQQSFDRLAKDMHAVLARQAWFTLTDTEWRLLLSMRYGSQVLSLQAKDFTLSDIEALLKKMQRGRGLRDVVDVHRLFDWLLATKDTRPKLGHKGNEAKIFDLVIQYGDVLVQGFVRLYANDPQSDFDRRVKLYQRFIHHLTAKDIDFASKKAFVAIFEFGVSHPVDDRNYKLDSQGQARQDYLVPFLRHELQRLEAVFGYKEAFGQIAASVINENSIHRYGDIKILLGLTTGCADNDRAAALEQILRVYQNVHRESAFSNSYQEGPISEEFKYLTAAALASEQRAALFDAALDYVPHTSGIAKQYDAYFETLWEFRDRPEVRAILMNPKVVGALTFHANKKKLAQWQLDEEFALESIQSDLMSGATSTPHHAMVRPLVHDIQAFIARQFTKNSTLKDAVIDFAEDRILSTAAENDVLREGRLDLHNWHKASELALADLPALSDRLVKSNFDRLETMAYLVGRQPEVPRFVVNSAERNFLQKGLDNLRRAFTEANPYARAAFLQSFLDENDGIFSDAESIAELEELILGEYNHEPAFKAIYHAYLTSAPREEVKVLLATLLATFVDAPPGTRGASLKEILNSMGPFGYKAAQAMRTSGIVGRKLAEELDSFFDRAAPPSRKKIIDDLRLVFGENLDNVYGIRELVGAGSINYVVVVDLINPHGEIERVAVQIMRDNVEGLIANENEIWEQAIAILRQNPDITVKRYAGIVDEARRQSMATVKAGGDELDVSVQTRKYAAANEAYKNDTTKASGRRIRAVKPVTWAMDLVPEEWRHKFAVYEHIDFVQLMGLDEAERIAVVTDIIVAELTAIRKREDFDPDGHRGNWLVAKNGKDLVRIDYAQLRRMPLEERLGFLAVFNQLLLTQGSFTPDLISGLSFMLPQIFDNLPAGVPLETILTQALNSPEAPNAENAHQRLFFLRDQISDYIQNHSDDPTYLLQFTDVSRSVLTSLTKISGYRSYIPEADFQMAMVQGLFW